MKSRFLLGTMVWLIQALPSSAAEPVLPHWEYFGHEGPQYWGKLSSEFESCGTGKSQSPINIVGFKGEHLQPIEFAYASSAADLVNNGHTVQVNLPNGGSIKLNSGSYHLAQFHFHSPSEESINGKHYPLVAHLVHKKDDGSIAVVAVLFKEGRENRSLSDIFKGLPKGMGETVTVSQSFDASNVLPTKQEYYAYVGSLTTSPCTEGVQWRILKEPVEVSTSQLRMFRAIYKLNARPVQPLNGRLIQVGG